jgi:hypothetical protein
MLRQSIFFNYLETELTGENKVEVEISIDFKSGNKKFPVTHQKITKDISRMHKTVIRPAQSYAYVARTMGESSEERLAIYEMEILTTIFGTVCGSDLG